MMRDTTTTCRDVTATIETSFDALQKPATDVSNDRAVHNAFWELERVWAVEFEISRKLSGSIG